MGAGRGRRWSLRQCARLLPHVAGGHATDTPAFTLLDQFSWPRGAVGRRVCVSVAPGPPTRSPQSVSDSFLQCLDAVCWVTERGRLVEV